MTATSCDLLSNCIFDVLNTTLFLKRFDKSLLWFAFKLYLWRIEHNQYLFMVERVLVVICFQIVSLTYWTQLSFFIYSVSCCCDLLSNCIFDVLNTTRRSSRGSARRLWFAFKLYLWRIEHNLVYLLYTSELVVICFQIVSLTYWTQRIKFCWLPYACCDLLSNCIFDVLNTTTLFTNRLSQGCDLLSNCIFDVLNTTNG